MQDGSDTKKKMVDLLVTIVEDTAGATPAETAAVIEMLSKVSVSLMVRLLLCGVKQGEQASVFATICDHLESDMKFAWRMYEDLSVNKPPQA